ncbi:MAG: hypothetical protein U0V75_11690 [Ferruginibacter sp.]
MSFAFKAAVEGAGAAALTGAAFFTSLTSDFPPVGRAGFTSTFLGIDFTTGFLAGIVFFDTGADGFFTGAAAFLGAGFTAFTGFLAAGFAAFLGAGFAAFLAGAAFFAGLAGFFAAGFTGLAGFLAALATFFFVAILH